MGRGSILTRSSISVALTDDLSVRNCLDVLLDTWYSHTDALSEGRDIVINNAGIYTAARASHIWETNLVAPCFITETISGAYVSRKVASRSLRFVQVASRLEKDSAITADNLKFVSEGALADADTYDTSSAYADTKRCLLLHTAYMCSQYGSHKSISFSAVTPGMVNTDLGKSSVSRFIWWISTPVRFLLFRHPVEGAVAVLSCAFGCPEQSGLYTADPGQVIEQLSATRDVQAGKQVSEIIRTHFNIV